MKKFILGVLSVITLSVDAFPTVKGSRGLAKSQQPVHVAIVRNSSVLPSVATMMQRSALHNLFFSPREGILVVQPKGIVVPRIMQQTLPRVSYDAALQESQKGLYPSWLLAGGVALWGSKQDREESVCHTFADDFTLKSSSEQVEWLLSSEEFEKVVAYIAARRQFAQAVGCDGIALAPRFKKYITRELLQIIADRSYSAEAERARLLLPLFATMNDSVSPVLSKISGPDRLLHALSCDVHNQQTRDELVRDYAFIERSNDSFIEPYMKNLVSSAEPSHIVEIVEGSEREEKIKEWVYSSENLD